MKAAGADSRSYFILFRRYDHPLHQIVDVPPHEMLKVIGKLCEPSRLHGGFHVPEKARWEGHAFRDRLLSFRLFHSSHKRIIPFHFQKSKKIIKKSQFYLTLLFRPAILAA